MPESLFVGIVSQLVYIVNQFIVTYIGGDAVGLLYDECAIGRVDGASDLVLEQTTNKVERKCEC